MRFAKRKKRLIQSDPFGVQEGKFKFGRLNISFRKFWIEDAYVPKYSDKESVKQTFNYAKLPIFGVFAALLLFLLLGRTAWLQIVKGDYYYDMAEGNRIRIERIEAKRGVIYDSNGVPLVRNGANFLLYMIPADLPRDAVAFNNISARIGEILGQPYQAVIADKLDGIDLGSIDAYQPVFIADNIDYDKAMLLYLESDQWPGVVLSNQTRREYGNTAGLSLSHILGYTGKISETELAAAGDEYLPIDYIGKMGVESFWESELRGENGKKQIEVDAFGKENKILSQKPGADGHNLVLTIDANMQGKLEEILSKALGQLGKTRAVAIAMDPNNGEIKAMVSLPAYNNNLFARGITPDEYSALISDPDRPLFDRAISGEYPSGSTIKPIWSAAALEEHIVTENTTFNSVGGIRVGQWYFPDWLAGGHGIVNMRRAIAESINTYFYIICGGYEDVNGLGLERMNEYGKLFGLDAQTGIDLPGEADGFLPTRDWKKETKGEDWYIGDTYHMAIGQGDLLVTPLQVAAYTAVFANGGALYRPHVVQKILTADDKPFEEVSEDPVRANFIEKYNIEVVREGMRQTVTDGSARSLQSVPVPVAGKTGTAQWSTTEPTHAWFIGFAPYDHPDLVITVLIEEGGEGSSTAVPVAREFLTWYYGEYKPPAAVDANN